MREVKFGKKTIVMYDAIEELPIARYVKFTKYQLIESGVGASISSADNHIERAIRFLENDKDNAIKELENLRQCLFFIENEVNPNHFSFAVLIKSIDGVDKNKDEDLTEQGLRKTIQEIAEITEKQLSKELKAVKKKNRQGAFVVFQKSIQ